MIYWVDYKGLMARRNYCMLQNDEKIPKNIGPLRGKVSRDCWSAMHALLDQIETLLATFKAVLMTEMRNYMQKRQSFSLTR